MGGNAKLDKFTGIGAVLAGKYRMERVVGTGGMGVVAVARHLRLGSRVAVKFMLPRPGDSERSVARFLKEARTASRITNPHVARVFDVDLRDDGFPYIVMEYLQGDTLAAAIRRDSALDVPGSVDDLLAACEALAEAHALGIVHRDLKPGNLFRARVAGSNAYVLKVLDFGISKTFETDPEDVGSITTGTSFLGSPPYMSPEQITSPGSVDSRTDIWSLGVVLYECLTGTSPFAATTVGATCARILHEDPLPPSKLRSEVPSALDDWVLRCFSKDPGGRYQTILELARALAPFGSGASGRSLSSLESLWTTAEPGPREWPAVDSDSGDLRTETAAEPGPSLAVMMHSTVRRLPRGISVGGVVVLTLMLTAVAVVGVPWLRGPRDGIQGAPHPASASAGIVPSVALPLPSPVSSAASARTLEPRGLAVPPTPVASVRARRAPPPRPQSSNVPAPSSLLTALSPAPSAAPQDPESMYTYRK
jgi:eukaryotic-like serine/threonine-protein kinase